MSSPLRWKVDAVAERDDRQRPCGEGGTFSAATNCSVDMRLRTLLWARITAPRLPRFSLPPRMVAVPVGVDDEADRIGIDASR